MKKSIRMKGEKGENENEQKQLKMAVNLCKLLLQVIPVAAALAICLLCLSDFKECITL